MRRPMPGLPSLFRARPQRLPTLVRRWPKPPGRRQAARIDGPPPPSQDLINFLRDLGIALVRSGEATSQTATQLNKLARAYRADSMQFFVLPTGVFVRIGADEGAQVDFAAASGRVLRLDQVGSLHELVQDASAGQLSPTEGSGRLAAILATEPRFNVALILLAQILQTLGLGLIRNPAPEAMGGLAVLALLVGLLRLLARRFPVLYAALPVAAGITVTVVALNLPKGMTGGDPSQLLIPPLITFLPGAALTIGTIELATNALIAGAARLMYSFNVLFMLAFGILVGSQLSGTVIAGQANRSIGLWAPLIGVVVLGAGMFIDSSGPAKSLPWLLAALFVVWLVQFAGNQSGSGLLGAFLGGLALTPVAEIVERQRYGPPSQVVFLPSFWLLVPGSSSLAGLSELVSGSSAGTGATAGLVNLLTALITVLAIALGVLVGSGLTQSVLSDPAA